MIPKVIHYCWFGHNPLPDKAQQCIASWQKFLPDYEIKQWNESNFDIHITPFVYEAYRLKKWAFISDYARFWILYNYGGLYFDTDVDVIRNMDSIIADGPFMGCEVTIWHKDYQIAPGLGIGAEPKMDVYKSILDLYEESHIIDERGWTDLHTKTVVLVANSFFVKHGFVQSEDKQIVKGINIYPPDYFCPIKGGTSDIVITPRTYTIHHYSGSWVEQERLQTLEEPFWTFWHLNNKQLLFRLRNLCYRYSFYFVKAISKL